MIGVSCLGSYGRLGNQMFQYAAAYSLSQKHDSKVAIGTRDSYSVDGKLQLSEIFELSSAVINNFSAIKYQFHEKNFQFADISNLPDHTDIVGYFQSEKYFESHKQKIIEEEFIFKKHILEKTDSIFENLKSDLHLCSLHVRRGDYLKLSDTHPPLEIDYYEQAISFLPKEIDILVFSDNIEEAKNLLESSELFKERKKKYVSENHSIEMSLMTRCNYHVIANSSFSWWGAWLSESKCVIAPKLWFGSSGPKVWDDIYCKNWITV